jgi:hypothetical protein
MKVHLAVSRPGFTPDSFITGHLCGREHSGNDGDNNSAITTAEVTCALCRAIIANPKHWRYRRYLKVA